MRNRVASPGNPSSPAQNAPEMVGIRSGEGLPGITFPSAVLLGDFRRHRFFRARTLRRRSGVVGLEPEKECRIGPGAIGAEKRACSALLNHPSKTTRAERKRCGSDGSC